MNYAHYFYPQDYIAYDGTHLSKVDIISMIEDRDQADYLLFWRRTFQGDMFWSNYKNYDDEGEGEFFLKSILEGPPKIEDMF